MVSIALTINDGDTIVKDTVHMSMPPTLEATTYCAMYVFKNHLHVSSDEEHLITRDSGIDSRELVHTYNST